MDNYICWSKDKENLKRASSGGIFYELAKETLKRNGMVVGVAMTCSTPYYMTARNLMGVKIMQGSKYLRANMSDGVLRSMESFKGEILFVGLPCTIAKMKNKFKHKDNIIYIQLFCHGTIVQEIFHKYIKKHHPNAISVKFRDKSKGWRGSVKLCVDGKCHKSRLMKDYIQFKNLEATCKICKKHKAELIPHGDILLGDYWKCPVHLENKQGTSQVITVTPKGQHFFDALDNIERRKNSLQKIAIMGGASTNNNGSMILTQNFISYLSKEIKDIDFTIVGYEGTPWEARKNILIGYIKSLFQPGQDCTILEKQIRDCQTIVYLGGDHFIGKIKRQYKFKWLVHFFFTCINFYNLKRSGRRVYLVSQTMGQFPFYIKPFIKQVFGRLDKIYCRDTFSYKELKSLGLKNISLCADLAFLPLHNENSCKLPKTLSKRYTVFVISDLWRDYCNTKDEFTDKLAYTANVLNKITKLPVYIMVHSSKKTPIGEAFILKKLKKIIHNSNIHFLDNDTPAVQRKILGKSELNVSLRMHASLSSLEQGVPVIPIAYSVKYRAMYSDLQLEGLVVDRLNVFEIKDKIEYVWRYKADFKYMIYHKLKYHKVQELALKPIVDIAKEIKNV